MFKKFRNILLLSLLGLASCSQGADEPIPATGTEGNDGMHSVELAVSRATLDEFATAGIDKYTIFIYKIERKGTTLFAEKEVTANNEKVTMEFSLGDNFQTFLVANASNITGKESLETVAIHLDPASSKQVWMSTPVRFASDKSTNTVSVTLRRIVSLIDFVPAETDAELAAQSDFDRVDLTFGNVATEYMVGAGAAVATTYTATTDAARGYKTSFYTFETSALDDATLAINYYKGGNVVNTSAGILETATKFAAHPHYTVSVPLTSPSFIERPWSTLSCRANLPAAISVTKTAL